MGQHAERSGDRPELRRQAHDERVEADQDQQEHHRDRENERRDLIARHARRPYAHAGEAEDQ